MFKWLKRLLKRIKITIEIRDLNKKIASMEHRVSEIEGVWQVLTIKERMHTSLDVEYVDTKALIEKLEIKRSELEKSIKQ